MEPVRARRYRTKGFKMVHENGLPNYYVGRPGKFGNPFKIIDDLIYVDASFRRSIADDEWVLITSGDHQLLLDLYRAVLTDTFGDLNIDLSPKQMLLIDHWIDHFSAIDLAEIRGKNLYCYCEAHEKCHGDVLLELANKEMKEKPIENNMKTRKEELLESIDQLESALRPLQEQLLEIYKAELAELQLKTNRLADIVHPKKN